MSSEQRAALFWLGCMPARASVTYIAATAKGPTKNLLRVSAAGLGAVWLLQPKQLLDYTDELQGPIWWKDERTIHGTLWALYAATDDWRALAIDTIFGGLNWILNENKK